MSKMNAKQTCVRAGKVHLGLSFFLTSEAQRSLVC